MPDNSLPIGAVFLSYASQDAPAAERICEALRTAGIEVWLDKNELRGGDSWDTQIKKHIHDCALFIPVISAHTNARSEGYFRREWKQATRRLQDMADDVAFLVPVAIDETREADARVPEEFLHAQWTRLPGGETPPAFAQRVRHLLGADILTEQAAKSAGLEPNARGGYSRNGRALSVRLVGLALIALIVLGGGAFLYYQGARDTPVATPTATTASAVVAAAPHERSIAVLPLVNMSSDKEQEYFSDGLSEELLNLLARIPELRVAARTSSFYFKGKDVKLTDLARELQVAYLLEGSVRKSGNRIRVTAQLIRASDGYHQWSETYDRTLDDIFAVQEEIAAAVVKQLKVTLLGAAPKVQKTSPEAYALYLQARQLYRQYTLKGLEQSIALYQQALAIDPTYAAAWNGLAEQYVEQGFLGLGPRSADECFRLAREAANKALAINPEYVLPHANLSQIARLYDDLAAAARHMEQALALDPADPYTLRHAAMLYSSLGRPNTAIEVMEYAAARDPLDPGAHSTLGWFHLRAGRLDEAIASFRANLKLSPDTIETHYNIGVAMLLKGDKKAALAAMQEEPEEGWRLTGLALAYHALGQVSASDAALAELIKKHEKSWSSTIARVYAFRGEADRAFEWLNKAVAYHDTGVASFPNEPLLSNLHDDPRWLPFLRKLGKTPEQLAAIKLEVKLPQ